MSIFSLYISLAHNTFNKMTLVQLEYIIAVNKFRHFVKAAEYCHVTQPTLSMQIKKFEEELNVIIFDRNKQPIEPTVIGVKIIEQAKLLSQGKERIHEVISDARENVSGELKIGIIPTIANNLVPLFVPKMAEKYPELKIHIEELMTHQVIEKIKQSQIDIGIIATPALEEGLNEIPVYYEPFVTYVSDDHKLFKKDKISSRDLNVDDMWLLADGHCFRNHIINLCGVENYYPQNMKFGYKTGSLEVLMKLVDKHYGYTLIPYLSTIDMDENKLKYIREFKEPTPKREVSIVTPVGFLKLKILDTLKKEIQQSIPKNLHKLDSGVMVKWK